MEFILSCSVILCSYNGASKIAETIRFLALQKTIFSWELIFIDNNSSDNTFNLADQILKETRIDYRIEKCTEPGKMYAFWKGIEMAKYDFILDCDDDNQLFPDFIQKGLDYLNQNPDVGAMGGEGILNLSDLPEWFNLYSKSYAIGPQGIAFKKYFKDFSLYGAGCFYKKSILLGLRVKGFQFLMSCRKGETLSSGGDVELCYLISLSGYGLVYHPELKFYHAIPKERITWEYYLRLKKGISSSAGLLSSYKYYSINSSRPVLGFLFSYWLQIFRSMMLYVKYRIHWKDNPSNFQDQLSYAILKSQMKAFQSQGIAAFSHFNQLKRYFGS